MIKKLIVISLLSLAVVIGAAYFVLWPLAQQYLAAVNTVLTPALENVQESLPNVSPEGVAGIGDLIAVLPILESIGLEMLSQIKELSAGGVTVEEAQQALDILRKRLSVDELVQLRTLLNLQ